MGLLSSPFLKKITLSDRKMIQKLYSMLLYDIRGQLYEYTIYKPFDHTITPYKRNSVYDNTLVQNLNHSDMAVLCHVKESQTAVSGGLADKSAQNTSQKGPCQRLQKNSIIDKMTNHHGIR